MNLPNIFDKPENREQIIKYMKEIEKVRRKEITDKVMNLLNEPEKFVHDFIQSAGYVEGSWYRPSHNNLCTIAGKAICEKENFPRYNVFGIQLHDVGNSKLKISSKGTAWEDPKLRKDHATIADNGAFFALGLLRAQGYLPEDKDFDIINKLCFAIKHHDDPYNPEIRKELLKKGEIKSLDEQILTTSEEIVLRSADRIFVPSALSYYKDLISHFSEKKYQESAKKLGIGINPLDFLLCRMAFYYPNSDALPENWDQKDFPLRTELASYNEGGFCEPCYTKTEKKIVDFIFNKRANEIFEVLELKTPEKFAGFFEEAFLDETNSIINFANKNKNYSLS